MQVDRKTGLVLEGGGMRGVFTSGVLDAFMKHGLYFRYTVAVSAGACNGLSYASRQPRRARISNIDMLAKYDYIGLRHLVTQGCFRNCRHGEIFEMVTTNCQTGFAEYLTETSGNTHRLNELARASSSLPYVSKIVMIDGIPMLDGGIVDSIPVMRSIETGHETNVVVCTRNKGWRETGRDHKQPKFIYRNYPRLRVALSHRIESYNRQLDLVDELEEQGKILVIRPEKPVVVGRMEKDISKLEALYEEGFLLGERFAQEHLPAGLSSDTLSQSQL